MYQTIHEPIVVAGVFQQGVFNPKKFRWNERIYQVDQITLQANLRDGGVQQRSYGVVSGANLYRLLYNRDSEEWFVEEVWCE
jgi:hypothetical protein